MPLAAGWEFGEKGAQGGMGVSNFVGGDGGLGCGRDGSRASFWIRVTNAKETCEAVKTAEGTPGEIFETPEGIMSECYNDQVVKFGLVEPAPGL